MYKFPSVPIFLMTQSTNYYTHQTIDSIDNTQMDDESKYSLTRWAKATEQIQVIRMNSIFIFTVLKA